MSLFFLFPCFFGKIYQLHAKVQKEKKACVIHWNLMNEREALIEGGVLQK